MSRAYRNDFLREIEQNVEEGEWAKMCIQCGACSESCPLESSWEHGPHKIFAMIRAGKREQVLSTDALWMCTSCHDCMPRCPANMPVMHIIHGLAHYAEQQGLAPKNNPTRRYALKFWDNIEKHGRINEAELGMQVCFMDGFGKGLGKLLRMKSVCMEMIKTKRLSPLALGSLAGIHVGHTGVADKQGLSRILDKAKELEAARKQGQKEHE